AAYQQGAKNSRAWVYIGLAIRIAQDMGLHRDSAKWSLDEKQTEVRKRTWWACYTFDRFISAGLGRVSILVRNALNSFHLYPNHKQSMNLRMSSQCRLTNQIAMFLSLCLVHYLMTRKKMLKLG